MWKRIFQLQWRSWFASSSWLSLDSLEMYVSFRTRPTLSLGGCSTLQCTTSFEVIAFGHAGMECAADKSAATATVCPFLANISLSNEERLQQPAGFLFCLFHQCGSERGKQGATEGQTPNLHQTVSTYCTIEHYLIFIWVLILLYPPFLFTPQVVISQRVYGWVWWFRRALMASSWPQTQQSTEISHSSTPS